MFDRFVFEIVTPWQKFEKKFFLLSNFYNGFCKIQLYFPGKFIIMDSVGMKASEEKYENRI